MINAEKFKNKIAEVLGLGYEDFGATKDDEITPCVDSDCYCYSCLFWKERFCSRREKIKWLLSEYKGHPIKVSNLEYDILKYLSDNTAYLYIARDKNGKLFIYRIEPIKNIDCWNGKGCNLLTVFNKLFQFVQWKDNKATRIKDVLKNCEVISDGDY